MFEINFELKKLIEENALALSTIDSIGNPHCIAVAFCKVISKNKIIITDNYMVETRNNIQKNNNVAIAVWNKEWGKECIGFELKGTAEYFNEGEYFEKVKSLPENKGEPCKGLIVVTINKIKKLV